MGQFLNSKTCPNPKPSYCKCYTCTHALFICASRSSVFNRMLSIKPERHRRVPVSEECMSRNFLTIESGSTRSQIRKGGHWRWMFQASGPWELEGNVPARGVITQLSFLYFNLRLDEQIQNLTGLPGSSHL